MAVHNVLNIATIYSVPLGATTVQLPDLRYAMSEIQAFLCVLCQQGEKVRDPVKCVRGLGLSEHPIAADCFSKGGTDAQLLRKFGRVLKQVIYHVDGPSLHADVDIQPSDFNEVHRVALNPTFALGHDAHGNFKSLWRKYALQYFKLRLSEWDGPLPF